MGLKGLGQVGSSTDTGIGIGVALLFEKTQKFDVIKLR